MPIPYGPIIGIGGAALGIGNMVYGNQGFQDLWGMTNPQYGTTTALTGMQGGYLDPNSPYNRTNRNLEREALDDYDRRTRGAMDYVRRGQMQMENFRNNYTAAEGMLNRYLQQRQIGAGMLNNAYSQRF